MIPTQTAIGARCGRAVPRSPGLTAPPATVGRHGRVCRAAAVGERAR